MIVCLLDSHLYQGLVVSTKYTAHTSDLCAKSQRDNVDPALYARFQMWIELHTSQIIIGFFCILVLHILKRAHTLLVAGWTATE